ncbi:MAG: histidine kinase [Chloroflexota bacterium]|nr:histidine kinase [Chloroflexota bacterium]
MPTSRSTNGRFEIDWLISNLRWLLLVSVVIVSFTGIFIDFINNEENILDVTLLIPQIILLILAVFYNLCVMFLLSYGARPRFMPVVTLLLDTLLVIGLVITSGCLTSPLLFFALFPILTTVLRFPWIVSLIVTLVIVMVCGFAGSTLAPPGASWVDLLPFAAKSLILLLAAVVSGLVGDRVKQTVAHQYRIREESELRELRTVQDRSRAIFELASTLSATLNYNKVLKAMLEVGEAGMHEWGRPDSSHLSMVLLFGQNDLHIAASRHLTQRDQKTTFQGQKGILAQVLTTAEALIVNNPSSDPELGQLVMMHSCRQAIVVPLRAGFESFGMVVFANPQPIIYTEEHKNLLIAICNQAIVALQNAQLYQSLTEEKERIVEVEEDARKKLARDLHDGPTQSLAAIAMRLNYAQMLLEKKKDIPQTVEELARTEDLARRTTKEIRHMLFTLRPLILESQGLQAALEQYISKLTETDDLVIHLEAAPEADKSLDRNIQGVIFYIIDEAIGNARKHAQAQRIQVRLYLQDNVFIAEVADNGRGFDVDAVQTRYDERGSLGMVNMYERADMVGGKLEVVSEPGKGTRITLSVPLQEQHGRT